MAKLARDIALIVLLTIASTLGLVALGILLLLAALEQWLLVNWSRRKPR